MLTATTQAQKSGFSCADVVYVFANAFHSAKILVCEMKTRFLMRGLRLRVTIDKYLLFLV